MHPPQSIPLTFDQYDEMEAGVKTATIRPGHLPILPGPLVIVARDSHPTIPPFCRVVEATRVLHTTLDQLGMADLKLAGFNTLRQAMAVRVAWDPAFVATDVVTFIEWLPG